MTMLCDEYEGLVLGGMTKSIGQDAYDPSPDSIRTKQAYPRLGSRVDPLTKI